MTHRAAVVTIVAAGVTDVVCGLVYAGAEHISAGHALYCAVGNAVTEGACTAPVTAAGHWVNLLEFLLVVPLFAAAFSLFTSGLTGAHVRRAEKRIKAHVEERLKHHVGTRGTAGDG